MLVHSLGYLVLASPSPDAWLDFAPSILGGVATRDDAGVVRVRLDEMPWRIEIRRGESTRLLASGWEVRSGADLDRVVQRLTSAGVTVESGTEDVAEARGVERLIRVADPGGNQLEIYHSPTINDEQLHLQGVSGYVMGDMGLGHVVLPAPDLDASFDFYTRLLEFRHRDTMRISRPGSGGVFRMRFLGCNPRHHSVGLAEMAEPSGMRHLMLEMAEISDVGRAYDRARKVPGCLRTHLGQHSNDEMFSFYLYTPEGFAIEVGTGGRRIDDALWSARELRHLSYWGYEFVGARG